jgi:hypothetical protein
MLRKGLLGFPCDKVKSLRDPHITHRFGQNRIYTPYMTVYLVISLPKIPCIHRIYMVLANPIFIACELRNRSISLLWDVCYIRDPETFQMTATNCSISILWDVCYNRDPETFQMTATNRDRTAFCPKPPITNPNRHLIENRGSS